MKYRITDDKIPGEELILDIELDEPDDEPKVDRRVAFDIIEFWESSDQVGARGSYDLGEDGILVLAEVATLGDEIELGAWYIDELDYPLDGFPFTSLRYERISD